jgi:hypothetical protein
VTCFSGQWLLWRVSVGSGSCGVFRGTCITFLEELSSTARHLRRIGDFHNGGYEEFCLSVM